MIVQLVHPMVFALITTLVSVITIMEELIAALQLVLEFQTLTIMSVVRKVNAQVSISVNVSQVITVTNVNYSTVMQFQRHYKLFAVEKEFVKILTSVHVTKLGMVITVM